MQTTPVFLPQKPQEQYEKAKRQDSRGDPQVSWCTIGWWGEQRNNSRKNGEAGPEQKQRSGVWWFKSNAIKNNCAQEPGMLGS